MIWWALRSLAIYFGAALAAAVVFLIVAWLVASSYAAPWNAGPGAIFTPVAAVIARTVWSESGAYLSNGSRTLWTEDGAVQ